MSLRKDQLINLPVVTQSGESLGRVYDFEVEEGTHMILRYHVRGGTLLKELLGNADGLIVSHTQVVELGPERMVVVDAVMPVQANTNKKTIKKPALAS